MYFDKNFGIVFNKNKIYKKSVKLRNKKLKSGNISLYLDIYLGNKKRKYEFLGITYNPKNIIEKREKRNIGENIRVKKELDLLNNDYGIKNNINDKSILNKILNEIIELKQKIDINILKN